jgi:fructokinase
VGTGVGVGLVINGLPVHGLLHPETGHLQVRLHPLDESQAHNNIASTDNDSMIGTCPYHGCCIEGLCSTGALAKRAGVGAADLPSLPDDHPVWAICAYYLGEDFISWI